MKLGVRATYKFILIYGLGIRSVEIVGINQVIPSCTASWLRIDDVADLEIRFTEVKL